MEAAVERPTAKQPSLGKLFFFGAGGKLDSTDRCTFYRHIDLFSDFRLDKKKIDRYCRNKDGTKKEQTIYCPMQ